MRGLLDTGASDCFMTTKLAKRLGLKINNVFDGKVALADKDIKSKVMGKAHADLVLGNVVAQVRLNECLLASFLTSKDEYVDIPRLIRLHGFSVEGHVRSARLIHCHKSLPL